MELDTETNVGIVVGRYERLKRLGRAASGLDFHWDKRIYSPQEEVLLQCGIISLEIDEVFPGLAQRFRDRILGNSSLVRVEIAVQLEVKRGFIVKHRQEQPRVGHVQLERVAPRVAPHGQFRERHVAAFVQNPRFDKPLHAPLILAGARVLRYF